MSNTEMAKEEVKEKVKVTEAEKVAKVTVSFTLAPEGKESLLAKGDQPVALEDSAILRLAPSSEEATNTNRPAPKYDDTPTHTLCAVLQTYVDRTASR